VRARREIDDQIFKYVGVGGVDKARIVQVGVGAGNLCKIEACSDVVHEGSQHRIIACESRRVFEPGGYG
jgi:hypothetical protein